MDYSSAQAQTRGWNVRPHRLRRTLAAASAFGLLFGPLFVGIAAADHGPGDDTNDDGVEDDFDHDGVADDLDGDCIPDDFNGDGIPDADNTDNSIYYDNCDPADFEGEGGALPESLPLQTVIGVLDPLYQFIPDVTEPGEEPDLFPNIPRLIDPATGEDLGPDWSVLDNVLGFPGDRDLTQLPDNEINEVLLEFEDVNNTEFVDPITGEIELVATPESLQHTITQINRARGDLGLIAGSGSTLRGPCMGMAWSYDADGQPLDIAWDWDRDAPPISFRENIGEGEIAVEQVFHSDRPFKVHVDGAVIYTGIAGGLHPGSGPIEHDWFIRLEFLGFSGANIDAGGDPNPRGKNRNAGALAFFEDIPEPAKISGLVAANGQMRAPGTGTGVREQHNGVEFFCIASGFVEFQGGLPLSAPGVALVFLSTVGMLFNARPAKTWGGI